MSLAKNSLLYLASTICLKAVSFFLLPLYTHLVTPQEYGYVYVVSALVTFLSMFFSLSVHGAISRFYFDCKSMNEVKNMYSQIVVSITALASFVLMILMLFKSTLAAVIGIPCIFFVEAIIISYFSLFYNLILALLYSMESAFKISITSIFIGIVTIIFQVTLVFVMNDKAQALIMAMLINALLSFIIFLFYSRPYFVIPTFSGKDMNNYIKFSLSQLPSDVSCWFISASDRVLLNRIQGAQFAGVYGMGNTLGQIPNMMFTSVNKAYAPYIFRHYKAFDEGDRKAIKVVVDTTIKVEGILTLAVVSLIIFSNNIVSILNNRYIDSAIIMPLVLIAVWIDCNRLIFMNPIVYRVKYVKIKSLIWIIAGALDIGLNFYLIPKYNMYGACASLIISYGLSCILILYFSNKAMHINYNIRKLLQLFFVSFLFSLSYFIGSDVQSLYLKLPLVLLYSIVIIYISNLHTNFVKFFKRYV